MTVHHDLEDATNTLNVHTREFVIEIQSLILLESANVSRDMKARLVDVCRVKTIALDMALVNT